MPTVRNVNAVVLSRSVFIAIPAQNRVTGVGRDGIKDNRWRAPRHLNPQDLTRKHICDVQETMAQRICAA